LENREHCVPSVESFLESGPARFDVARTRHPPQKPAGRHNHENPYQPAHRQERAGTLSLFRELPADGDQEGQPRGC